jgi:hypothetical protein
MCVTAFAIRRIEFAARFGSAATLALAALIAV